MSEQIETERIFRKLEAALAECGRKIIGTPSPWLDLIADTEPTEPTPPTKTLEQHQADLNQWLQERGLVPVVVAVGKYTGTPSPIADFMPRTHDAQFFLLEARNAGNS